MKNTVCPPRQIGIRYWSSSSLSVFASSGCDLKEKTLNIQNQQRHIKTHLPASLFTSLVEPKVYV